MYTLVSKRPGVWLILAFVAMLSCFAASVAYGISEISIHTVWSALTDFNGSKEHVIIRTVRLPRALIALVVGACLGAAGAIMQALTRNPLASPDILGVNQGAALLMVLSIFFMDDGSLMSRTWFAMIGAALAAVLVYGLSSIGHRGLTPLKLTLAGATMALLLSSLTQGILILHERSLDEMRFWLAGSVAGRDIQLFLQAVPFMVIGTLLAILLSKQINLLSLGDDVAYGLGQKIVTVKLLSLAAVVLLTGSAVSVAGPIGFIGLAVPHIVRSLIGSDYRWVFPYSAVLGAITLLAADIGARFFYEVPIGVMTALIGAPFFIFLARRSVH